MNTTIKHDGHTPIIRIKHAITDHFPFYTSIDSVKRSTPLPLSTPSTPLGGRGNGSASGSGTSDTLSHPPALSTTSASPCDLMASTSAGTMSYK